MGHPDDIILTNPSKMFEYEKLIVILYERKIWRRAGGA